MKCKHFTQSCSNFQLVDVALCTDVAVSAGKWDRVRHGVRGCAQVWDVDTRKLKLELPGHADEVFTVDWSPDGASVASGSKDRLLRLWRQ